MSANIQKSDIDRLVLDVGLINVWQYLVYHAKVNKSTHLELYFQTKLNINYNVCNHLTIIYVQRTLLPHLGFFWLAIAKTGYQWPQTILEYI